MEDAKFHKENKVNYQKYHLDDFPHLKKIRDYSIQGPAEFCIERAKLYTEFLKEKGGLKYTDPMTRQAEAIKYILKNRKPNIFPNHLIAGSSTSKKKGVIFFPEFSGGSIWPELLSVSVRDHEPYLISIQEINELDQEILPFWIDKNLFELVRQEVGDDDSSYKLQFLYFLFMISKFKCLSHTIPNYKRVLKIGLEGIIEEASKKLINANDTQKKFYKALITAMEGVIEYSNNLSAEAIQQAENCKDKNRKQQLEKIAEICKKVPLKPATSFYEAVQSIWTCQSALYEEHNNIGLSIGRIDQLLNDYYINDKKKGIITRKEAIEILAHFWAKFGDNVPFIPEKASFISGGSGTNQNITIGGCNQEGKNAVNETTYLCLDVTELVRIKDPNVSARVHKDDPPEYTQRLAEVIINTGATPSLFNDAAIIPALEKRDVSLRHARDYGIVACVEPNSSGRTFGNTSAIMFNLISALELVFYNGDMKYTKNVGLKTGKFSELNTFAQFKDALKKQLKFLIEHATRFNNIVGEVFKFLHPHPLTSALFEGPIKSGKSLLEGGAIYNWSGIVFVGFADLIDSLYAIKKLIYDDRKISHNDLLDILKSDFKRNKKIYNYVIYKLDHFGNGVEEVDNIGQEMVDFLYEFCTNIKNYRNGYYHPGFWSISMHIGFGEMSGALPHGKKEGVSLASGMTPVSFGQRNGPTAVCNSLSYLDTKKIPDGMALNMKFNKSLFKNQEKINIFKALFKTYFNKGGMQVQFIIQDAKTLIDAKKHPEKYPDLMVRISGYTVYFAELEENMMDEIINRALMGI